MTSAFINSLGNWNPQLLREGRGRLRPRSIAATILLSMIGQGLLGLLFSQQEEKSVIARWADLANAITWILPYVLFSLGAYYLVSDLNQEAKRGTLNFIRLSPRPSHQILLGKILGVPLLPYLAVVLAMPLHVIAGLKGGMPLPFLASYYLMLIVGAILLFSLAVLYGLISSAKALIMGQQSVAAIAFSALSLLLFVPLYMTWQTQITWMPLGINQWFDKQSDYGYNSRDITYPIQWFGQTINLNPWISHGFSLAVMAVAITLIWAMLMRLFRSPDGVLMSKRQSYAIVACCEALVVGFLVVTKANSFQPSPEEGTALLYAFNFALVLMVLLALCPHRLLLLDWLRYRRYPRRFGPDLVWMDKSPVLVAIAINLAIINALFLPWLLLFGIGKGRTLAALGVALCLCVILLIYTAVVQWIFTLKIRNPYMWAFGFLAIWMVVPATVLGILAVPFETGQTFSTLWTVLGYPLGDFSKAGTINGVINGVIILSCLLLFWVWQVQQRLQVLSLAPLFTQSNVAQLDQSKQEES
ncbi:MAG: hypothetical protein HC934_00750 [Acaryochloridaceae cyanobacterium SU_2_1]|nr:hypothetical protein [Acaryochloridaceae cyanobacterium SU_2_1]